MVQQSTIRENAFWAGIAAVLMLGYGWSGYFPLGISDNQTYNHALALYGWTLRIGGILLVPVTVLLGLGLRAGVLADMIVSGLSGLLMTGSAAVLLVAGAGIDFQDLLFLIFGIMFLHATRGCWITLIGLRAQGGPGGWFGAAQPRMATVVPPEVPHPASIHPVSLPQEGEPPPPDGYLAALSKEKEEPPRASYE